MATLFKRGSIWYLNYSQNGKRKKKSVSRSKKVAELVLKDTVVKIAKGEFLGISLHQNQTFEKLCAEYLEYSRNNKRPQTYRRYRVSTKNLKRQFTHHKIRNITVQDIERYKAKRIKEVEPATVNREITCIKHMFNKAVEWSYLPYNHIRIVRGFKEPAGRIRYLQMEEVNRLIQACSEHLKPIVIVAAFTGMRKGEILKLKWNDIDWVNRRIIIRDSKTNESTTIPISEIVYNTFRRLKHKSNNEPVFANKDGNPYVDVKRSFRTASRKANIQNFKFSDLRHTFASLLIIMAGCNIRTVQALMRHKDIRCTARYSHLSDEHLSEAVNKLGNVSLSSHSKCEKSVSLAKR